MVVGGRRLLLQLCGCQLQLGRLMPPGGKAEAVEAGGGTRIIRMLWKVRVVVGMGMVKQG